MPVVSQPVSVEIWNRPACQAGADRLGYLEGASELAAQRSVDRDEWCALQLSADQPSTSLLQPRRIVRLTYLEGTADGAYDEWRIGGAESLRWEVTPTGRVVRVHALGLHTDLTAAGPLYTNTSGIVSYQFTKTQSVSAWLDDLVAHLAAQGYGYIVKGTVDFASIETIALDHWTASEVMNELERRTRGEWQLRRNGATDYRLDLVARVGAGAPAVRFVEGQNLRTIAATENEVDLATEVLPTTGQGATTEGKGITRTAWKINAVNAGTKRVTIVDPNGVAGVVMIGENDQFNGEVMVCMRTGRPFTVVDTLVASQELEFAAVGDLVAGDYLERRADFTTGLERSDYEWNVNVLLPRVSNVASNVLTLVSMLNATDPVPTTNWERGLRLRAAPLQHTNTVTSRTASTRELVLGTPTSAVQVGDIGFAHTGGAEPYTKQTEIFEVETVVDTTHVIVKNRHNYHSNAVFTGTGAVAWNVRFYRPRATLTYIDSSDAAANTITVADAAGVGIAANDVVEAFVETGGRHAATLTSPSALLLYDKPKVIHYTRDDLGGERNLMAHANPWFRDWSGGASALPDQWVKSQTGTSSRQDAATLGGLYGPYVWQHTAPAGTFEYLRSTPVRPLVTAAAPGVVARIRIRPDAFGWTVGGSSYIDFGVSNDRTDGTVPGFLAFTRLIPPTGTNGPGTEVPADAWVELTLVVSNLLSLQSRAAIRHGLRLHLALNLNVRVQIDAVALYYGTVDPARFVEFDASPGLWSKAGEFLQAWRTVPQTITADIVDLYHADRTRFASKRLQTGGDIIIYSASAGVDTTVRAMSIQTDFRGRVLSQCTLNTAQQTLSRQLAGAT